MSKSGYSYNEHNHRENYDIGVSIFVRSIEQFGNRNIKHTMLIPGIH